MCWGALRDSEGLPVWWGSLGELSKGSLSSLKYHPLLIFSFKILSSDSIRRFPPEKQKHEDLTLSLYFPDLCIYFLCNLNFPLPCQPTKALQEVVLLRKRGAGSTQNRGPVHWERLPVVQESSTTRTQLQIVLPDLNLHAIKHTLKEPTEERKLGHSNDTWCLYGHAEKPVAIFRFKERHCCIVHLDLWFVPWNAAERLVPHT